MHRLSPTLNLPRLLPTHPAFLQIGKLPQMVHGIQIPDLGEPRADPFHDLPPRCQTATPVRFPLEQISRLESVRAQFKDPAETSGWGGGPKGKLLHQGGVFAVDERFDLSVVLREIGHLRDVVQRFVVSVVSLIFPYMNCRQIVCCC